MPNSCADIMVVGVGNPFRRDDGIGPLIAQKLKEKKLPETVTVAEGGQGISIMESWSGASMVIIIDAMHSGDIPGKIRRFDARKKPLPKVFFPCSTHHFGVAEAVELARAIHRLPPSLIIYGIEGKTFEQGIGLSRIVMKAAEEIEKCLLTDIHKQIEQPVH
ncbi:MAG: hydrogenase maturation protease [Pseudomonadota bacterium]